MNSRTRSRKAVSIGSNQSAKSGPASSASGCRASRFVVGLVMAWSPAQRANAGIERVGQPGDYATPNSNQPRDATATTKQQLYRIRLRAVRVWVVSAKATRAAAAETAIPVSP